MKRKGGFTFFQENLSLAGLVQGFRLNRQDLLNEGLQYARR